ncbi:MAG TPA: hypothetical protein VFR35_05190, partial [Actinoplanes sp.]|nr:hypothetical protein [Actinoplanes sp.]
MSLMVPSELRWIFVILAGDMWPALDEDKLRELARLCEAYAADLNRAADGLDSLVTNVLNGSHGSVGRAFLKYGYELDQYGQSFPGTADAMAKTLDDYALQGEGAKYSMLIAIAFIAAEILWALSTPFTAGLVPGIVAAGRTAVVRITERFFGRVGSILVRAAVEEAAQEVVEAGLAQLIQG